MQQNYKKGENEENKAHTKKNKTIKSNKKSK